MVADLDAPRFAAFGRPAIAVTEAGADVARPGCADPSDAARPDELIEQNIRDRSDEGEVASALPDDLVTCGERDERFKSETEGHGRTVGHTLTDGFGHRHEFGLHNRLSSRASNARPLLV